MFYLPIVRMKKIIYLCITIKIYKMETTSNYRKLPELELKYKSGKNEKVKIKSSIDSATVLRKLFNADTIEYNEEVIVLYLNGANKTIGWIKHSSGGTSQSVLDVKMILTSGLLCGASNIILAHNHPSGEMRPSEADKVITRRLKAGCDAIGMSLIEHIILSGEDENYYSFSDDGRM